MKISVVITLLNDFRVKQTIHSLLLQSIEPFEIIVADGGSNKQLMEMLQEYSTVCKSLKIYSLRGSVAKTRNKVIPLVKGDIIVFLDSDEIAPYNWLQCLVDPIIKNECDFTGGGTKPASEPINKTEKYVNNYSKWFYNNIVSKNISMLPMGNSAWKKKIFDEIGNFDERLIFGGEDYDINIRAIKQGFKGKYVEDAWVYHDQSVLSDLFKLIRKKFKYSVGASMTYFLQKNMKNKVFNSTKKNFLYLHPIELVLFLLKPIAFVKGYFNYKIYDNDWWFY